MRPPFWVIVFVCVSVFLVASVHTISGIVEEQQTRIQKLENAQAFEPTQYVPRTEIDARLETIDSAVSRIEKSLTKTNGR